MAVLLFCVTAQPGAVPFWLSKTTAPWGISACFDLVITTGGMGPTYDDLTKESIADYFGLSMVKNFVFTHKIHFEFCLNKINLSGNLCLLMYIHANASLGSI